MSILSNKLSFIYLKLNSGIYRGCANNRLNYKQHRTTTRIIFKSDAINRNHRHETQLIYFPCNLQSHKAIARSNNSKKSPFPAFIRH